MTDFSMRQVPIDTTLETPRCLLRYPELDDATHVFSALRSPAFPKHVPLGQITSLEEVKEWIEGIHSRWARGTAFTWTIERKIDHVLVGQVTLASMSEPDTWALAFWTHPRYWGQGYATETSGRVIEFGFHDLHAALIWAGAAKWNQGSLRVLEKLGFIHVSDNPMGYTINNEPIPTKEFEITLSRWQRYRMRCHRPWNK